jgi:hypothetical protein
MCLIVLEIDNRIRIEIVLIHAVPAQGGVKLQLHEFINSALDGGGGG